MNDHYLSICVNNACLFGPIRGHNEIPHADNFDLTFDKIQYIQHIMDRPHQTTMGDGQNQTVRLHS